jgi:hypothetical protein
MAPASRTLLPSRRQSSSGCQHRSGTGR